MLRFERESLGLELPPGAHHYRAYIGYAVNYDLVAAMTFGLVTTLGLRQQHKLVDIGCGSLRVGRLLIPYLNAGNYIGIEPNEWLVKEGISREVGRDLIRIKKPQFYFSDSPKVLINHSGIDFAVAQSIFSHCGLDLIRGWLAGVAGALAPTGALIATFLPDQVDSSEKGWRYPECVRYTPQTLQTIASELGLKFEILDWRHPHQTWALFANSHFDSSWFKNQPLSWNTMIDRQT